MATFELVLLVLTVFYVGSVVWLWMGLVQRDSASSIETPPVSVVVAARNEQAYIAGCLQALRDQDYTGSMEVIVVNDRSEDETAKIVAAAAENWAQLTLVQAPLEPRFSCPKKSALATGVEYSTGEILLFTDADCCPPHGWVHSMVAQFTDGIGLVAGYARFSQPTLLRHKLLALDNLAIGALGAGSIGMGKVLSTTGRNLAYRRAVYDHLGGFESIGHLMGGDDVYFARLVAERTNWELRFNRGPESVVENMLPPRRWTDLLQQKLRHAGKAGHYRGAAKLVGLLVYLFHAGLAIGLIQLMVFGGAAVSVAWCARTVVHVALLSRFAQPTERYLLRYLPLIELLYIPYILFFTLIGGAGLYRWKPRAEFHNFVEA